MVGAGSGCWEVAREVTSLPLGREGVPVRAGIGLAALFDAPGRIAGD